MDKFLVTLFVVQATLVDKLKTRREAGQGVIEYVAMFAVAGIIIAAVVAVLKPAAPTIAAKVTAAIQAVTGI